MSKFNPLDPNAKKEVIASVEDKPNSLTHFSETARVRPTFAPEVSPMFRTDASGKMTYVPGTYADILRSPRPQDWNLNATELRQLRSSMTGLVSRIVKNENAKGKTIKLKDKIQSNTLFIMSENGFKFIETIIDKAIPESIRSYALDSDTFDEILEERNKVYKQEKRKQEHELKLRDREREAREKGRPINFYTYFHDSFAKDWQRRYLRKANSKVAVKNEGSTFKVTLPFAQCDLSPFVSDMYSPLRIASSDLVELTILKELSSATRLNFGNSSKQSTVIPLADFFNFIPESQRLMVQGWDKALDKYVVGVKIEIGRSKLTAKAKNAIRVIDRHNAQLKGTPAPDLSDDEKYNEYFDKYEIDSNSIQDVVEQGSYLRSNAVAAVSSYLNRDIVLSLVTELPKEEAEFFVQSRGSEVKAADVLEFMRSLYTTLWLPLIEYFFPVKQVSKKNSGYTAVPRTNKDNVCVATNRRFYYIPSVNNIEEFDNLRDTELLDPETGELSFSEEQLQSAKKLKNLIIYTDWVNNKLTYTDPNGNLEVLDLEMMSKVRPHAVLSQLNTSSKVLVQGVSRALPFFANSCDRVFGSSFRTMLEQKTLDLVKELAGNSTLFNQAKVSDSLVSALSESDPIGAYINACLRAQLYVNELSIYPEKDSRIIFNEVYSNNPNEEGKTPFDRLLAGFRLVDFLGSKYGRVISETLDYHLEKVLPNLQNFIHNAEINSIPEFLAHLGMLVVLSSNKNRVNELKLLDKEARSKYTDWNIRDGDQSYVPVLPNVSKPKNENDDEAQRRFKNYQWRALSLLDKSPEFAILAVDAGGGKTIMCISNILQELEKKTVTRPLVVCPSHLVKDYVAEVNYLCAGKVNTVVINNLTIENYSKIGLKTLIDRSPINTIFVADYNAFSVGAEFELYCNLPVETFRNLDFFRSAGFDGVWLDEAHFLKNKSTRFYSVGYAISDIPLKRLLTGTLAPNRMPDIANQFSLLDPTVFGSQEQFKKEWEANTKDRDESEIRAYTDSVRARLDQHCTFILVKRREWAHELPPRIQTFEPLGTMTAAQQELYSELVSKELGKMRAEERKSKKSGKDDDDYDDVGEDSDSKDETEEKDLTKLSQHLSHIELFLSAPRAHPSAENLSNEDLISPKLPLIIRHYQDHMDFIKNGFTFQRDDNSHEFLQDAGERVPSPLFVKDGKIKEGLKSDLDPTQNKILVFTNWGDSVRETYANLPADIKSKTLVYKAEEKYSKLRQFKDEDQYQMMIGIGKSMNTGLNLQFCSRLIIMETVWSPGEIEQSLARVFRPSKMRFDENGVRLADPRSRIFINFTLVSGTIDIMKTANLITKSINISRVMNADNPLYDELPYLEETRLSLTNLEDFVFGDINLDDYLNAFDQLLTVEHVDFLTYARDNPDKLNNVDLVAGKNLEGSAILDKVPYVQGMSIYNPNPEQLKLIPYPTWKQAFIEENGWFDLEKISEARAVQIHSEIGDGIAVSEGKTRERKPKSALVKGDEVTDSFEKTDASDSDFDDDAGGEVDIESFKKKINKEAEIDTEDDSKSTTGKVKCLYELSTINLTEEEIRLWDEIGMDIEFEGKSFFVSLPEESLFVIDGSIDSKTVREFITSDTDGMKIVETDLLYKPDAKQTDPEFHADKIRKLIEAQNKALRKDEKKRKQKEDERKERDRKADDQLKESRGRGRPKKESVKDIPSDTVIVNPQGEQIKVKIAQFFGYSALMVYGENVDSTEVARVTSNAFIDIGDSLAFQVKSKGKEKRMMDFVNEVSPIFDEGTPVTTKTPIIKNPEQLIYDAKKKVYIRKSNGETFPKDVIDEGLFVNYKDERPEFDVEPLTIESLGEIEKSFANWVRAGRLLYIKGAKADALRIRRAYAKRVAGNNLRMFYLAHRLVSAYGISFVVPKTKNYTAAINKVSRIARTTMAAEKIILPNLMIGVYPMGKTEMIDDYNALIENFNIKNVDKLEEDYESLKLPRGRPSGR